MSRIGEIRKDPSDGELAIVEDIDEGADEPLETRGSNKPDEVFNYDEDEFDELYPEHVIGRKEVWRLTKECTPHWIGTDVEVTATSLTHITWRVVRKGPLMGSIQSKGESERLKKFLGRFRFMDYSWEEGSIPPHEATDAERAAVKKFEEDGHKEFEKLADVIKGDNGNDLYEALAKAAGTDVDTPITRAELIDGLRIACSIEEPKEGLADLMELLGVNLKEIQKRDLAAIPEAEQKKAVRSAVVLRRLVDKARKEVPEGSPEEAKTAKMLELINQLVGEGDAPVKPPSPPPAVGVPGNSVPWARGQVRRGDILNIAKGGGPAERIPIAYDRAFVVLKRRDPDDGPPLWAVMYGEALPPEGSNPPALTFRESWPNTLLRHAEGTVVVPLTWKVGERRRGPIFSNRAGKGDNIPGVEYEVLERYPTENYDWRVKATDGTRYGACETWQSELIGKPVDAGQSSSASGTQTGTQQSEKGTSTMTTKASNPTQEAVAKAMAILSGTTEDPFKDVTIRREGAQVVLPDGMSTKKAIEWLTRIDKEDDRDVALNHEIACYPIEGAYALYRALREKYGFVSLTATPTMLGPKPPVMVGFDVSLTEHVQVPWGRLQIPNVEGYLETNATLKPNGEFRFVLAGVIKRRHEEEVNAFVKLVKEFATTKSIYRGQAIRVTFPDPEAGFDFTYTPKFIDTTKVREEELVFPVDVQEMVETSVYTPIEQTAACREDGVPLKRGILLEGPFGVGKTLAAYVTAKKCVRNGWTFMYLDKTSDLKQAIKLAEHYQPCAIFAEDIDREVDGEERTEEMDAILNTIDGIDSKGSEIIVVLTTNDVAKINRAMLRPGRLDAVIPVRAPDAIAARRLVVNYARNLLRPEENLDEVGRELEGSIPAVIREVVERSKLAAIRRQANGQDGDRRITAADLLIAARGMKAQVALMTPKPEDDRSDIEKAMTAGAKVLVEGVVARWTSNVAMNGQQQHAELPAGDSSRATT